MVERAGGSLFCLDLNILLTAVNLLPCDIQITHCLSLHSKSLEHIFFNISSCCIRKKAVGWFFQFIAFFQCIFISEINFVRIEKMKTVTSFFIAKKSRYSSKTALRKNIMIASRKCDFNKAKSYTKARARLLLPYKIFCELTSIRRNASLLGSAVFNTLWIKHKFEITERNHMFISSTYLNFLIFLFF